MEEISQHAVPESEPRGERHSSQVVDQSVRRELFPVSNWSSDCTLESAGFRRRGARVGSRQVPTLRLTDEGTSGEVGCNGLRPEVAVYTRLVRCVNNEIQI